MSGGAGRDAMPTAARADSPRARCVRVLVALSIGLAATVLVVVILTGERGAGADFTPTWRAAQYLLRGIDPNAVTDRAGWRPYNNLWYYPLPAAFVALPLAWLPPTLAAGVFFGASCAAAAYLMMTRDGFARLPVFLSACFFSAAMSAQWGPFVLAAAVAPAFATGLLLLKPSTGLAGFAYRPTVPGAIGALALLAVSVALHPEWPHYWLAIISHSPYAHVALLTGIGPVLALAALRWRRPEARLLLTLALVPHTLLWYDEVLLWLVPRTGREALTLTLLSWAGFVGWLVRSYPRTEPRVLILGSGAPWLVAAVYLPCLIMVLRRPNEGPTPAWLDALLARRRKRDATAGASPD